MKRPESPKFQRAVSSSSELHAIQRAPRDTTTLAFLLILCQKSDSRGMRKSLHKVPTVLDFALTVSSSQNLCFVAPLLRISVALSLIHFVFLLLRCLFTPSLRRSVAPSLRHSSLCPSVAPSLRRSVAPSLCRSVAPPLFAPSLFRSIHSSLHNYSFYFLFSLF